jgi:hypothetical protein
VTLQDGTVKSVDHSGWDSVDAVAGIRYMSSSMRTFEAIKHYLLARKLRMESLSQHEAVAELCKDFKLYDVSYIEGLIAKMPLKLDPSTREALDNFGIREKITEIGVDLEKNDFYFTEDGKERRNYMCTMGKGHQSLVNMIIGQA